MCSLLNAFIMLLSATLLVCIIFLITPQMRDYFTTQTNIRDTDIAQLKTDIIKNLANQNLKLINTKIKNYQ